MIEEWHRLAEELARQLVERGVLVDPHWREAFENTPRHVFVPTWFRNPDSLVHEGDSDWLSSTYRDASLVTRYVPVPGAEELRWATSSSTMPSLMSRMLHLLDVRDGQRVLEIGTGTGYNAALLCYRLGGEHVTSIDLDPKLVRCASAALDSLGWQPRLSVGDGEKGVADRAPYDRIISTASVPAIPPAWVEQLGHDGVIVADLRGGLSSNLIVLHKTAAGSVEGRFMATPGHFMWCRREVENPLRDGGRFNRTYDATDPLRLTTDTDPRTIEEGGARLLVQELYERDLTVWETDESGGRVLHLCTDDASWCDVELSFKPYQVTQGGPTDIWDMVERALIHWSALGRPAAERFGLSVTLSGRNLWLDVPENVIV